MTTSVADPVTAPARASRRLNGWIIPGVLMISAAVCVGCSTVLFWLPCVTRGVSSQACLDRMDTWQMVPYLADPTGRVPGVAELQAVASLLVALAVVGLVVAILPTRVLRLTGMIAALQPLSIAAWSLVSVFTPWIDPGLPVSRVWWISGELVAVVAVFVIMFHSPSSTRSIGRVIAVLVGATTFGLLHTMLEVSVFWLSGYDWDVAPWTGSATAVVLLGCGLYVAAGRDTPDSDPHHCAVQRPASWSVGTPGLEPG